MSAQPHEPAPAATTRPVPTIRSVRAALPPEHRAEFQAAIETTPVPDLPRVVADWDLRAEAFAIPAMADAIRQLQDELAGRAPRTPVLTEDEIRAIAPGLRP